MTESERVVAMAFALHTSRAIVAADEKTEHREFQLLGAIYPRPMLRDAGLIDAHGRDTAAMEVALGRVHELRSLPEATRLDLLALLHGAAMIDDDLDRREWTVLVEACEALGLSAEDLVARLRSDAP